MKKNLQILKKNSKFTIGTEFIFFISTIEPRKNVNNLIKAFEEVKRNYSKDLKLIIAGGKGWKSDQTLELIKNSEYKDDIIIPGYIDEIEKYYLYKKCKLFVFPSIYEGFGIPILEAMNNGALVLTSNISSLPEVGGDAVVYINNPYNYKEIAEKINKVLKFSEEERKNYIKKGNERAKKFNWDTCALDTLKVLTE